MEPFEWPTKVADLRDEDPRPAKIDMAKMEAAGWPNVVFPVLGAVTMQLVDAETETYQFISEGIDTITYRYDPATGTYRR
jgi:spore maturation protein CgeB